MKNVIPAFLLGFSALSFQIILLREFSVMFFGNEITLGLILGTWLFWGALGSILASKTKFNSKRLIFLYHLLIILFALSLIGLRFSRFVLHSLPGELIGTIPIFFTALLLSFFTGFPLGMLFVFNIHYSKGHLAKVYILESLGSATAGFCLTFLLIPLFSNWQMTSILGFLFVLTLFISYRNFRSIPLFIVSAFMMTALWAADIPSQKIYWAPLTLVESVDTVYGTLHVIKTEEQISLYSNSVPIYSFPDLASAEELTHFPLLHKPDAEKVLLIGGGSGEELRQILKYPLTQVDCVELNPEIIRMSFRFLPDEVSRLFRSPRVQIFYTDGIAFLDRVTQKYDAILLNLPDPFSALINRFFTREFFLAAREKLHPNGILSFRVSSAENYISYELQDFLSSVYYTLKSVFPAVEIIPGNTNIFLASSVLPSLDSEALSESILSLNLNTTFVSPELLQSRLNPLRVITLKDTILSGKKKLNSDLVPISYFFSSVLWNKQFKSIESKFLSSLSLLPSFWLLDFPLICFISILIALGLKKRQHSAYFLTPLFVMGLSTLIVEIIFIISFQTVHGVLYQNVSLLFAAFMMGLFFGAIIGRKINILFSHMIQIQAGLILLITISIILIPKRPSEIYFFVFLFFLGLLNGDLFVVSNHLYLRTKKNYGLGYGLDLTGSFVGAIATSAFLIPLLGLPILLKYVLLLNFFCLLFLIWGFLRGKYFA
ncbi:spermidine synthase [Acidobacteriota bacterium]